MTQALSGAITIIQGFLRFVTDPAHAVMDLVSWLTSSLFPPELQTWFLGTLATPGSTWNPSDIYQSVFQAVQAPALTIAAAAAAARVVRATADSRNGGLHVIVDVLPRLLIVVGIVGIPGTDTSLGYMAIAWAINGSMLVAHGLFDVVMRSSLMQGMRPGEGWFTHLYRAITNTGHLTLAVVIGGIPLLILLLYAAFLMVVRTIMIGFLIVTAPLCLGTLVFDGRNRFVQWWIDLLIGALMTPIVFAIAIALSLTLAASVVSALVVGPILAFALVCGGLWMSGRMVHHITWRHFSHGGALAGFAAGVSTALSPLHKLATAGFLAEALGANRGGSSAAITAMKRIGLASQGFNPAGGASPAFDAASGHPWRSERLSDLVPESGVPDIAAVLNADGRNAVAGAEPEFSQQAFNAFARSHPAHIGTATLDVPHGSLSPAERARLAWERTSHREQAQFADRFFPTWLGHAYVDTADPVPARTRAAA